MTTPTPCSHPSVLFLGGKVSDMCFWTLPNGASGDGYVPPIGGIGSGDCLRLKICMDCKQVVGFEPDDVVEMMVAVDDEDELLDGSREDWGDGYFG